MAMKTFFSFLLDIHILCMFGSSKQILVCNSPDSTYMICQVSNLWAADLQNNIYS